MVYCGFVASTNETINGLCPVFYKRKFWEEIEKVSMKQIATKDCEEIMMKVLDFYPIQSTAKLRVIEEITAADWNEIATYVSETMGAGVSVTGKSIMALSDGAGSKNSTINILCAFLLLKKGALSPDERQFQEKLKGNRYYVRRYFATLTTTPPSQTATEPEATTARRAKYPNHWIMAGIGLLAAVFLLVWGYATPANELPPRPTLHLSIDTAAKIFPKEIKVQYDLTSEQYLNKAHLNFIGHRIDLTSLKGEVTLTVKHPKLYQVDLFSEGELLASKKAFLASDNWWGYLNNDSQLKPEDFLTNGQLHIENEAKYINPVAEFYTKFQNFRNFGVNGDNLELVAEVKNPITNPHQFAHDISVDVVGYKHSICFNLLSPAALQYANMVVGTTDYKQNDKKDVLRNLGILVPEWKNLKVKTKNNRITISLGDKTIINAPYEGEIGQVVGLQFMFKGAGYAKNVRLNGISI